MTIDVFSDVVCPWCYIGMARLDRALHDRPTPAAAKRWRPFQLQPQMPPGGLPWRAFAERKFGSWASAQAAFRHVEQAAANDGIPFDFSRIASAPNTADAHRLLLWARETSGDEWPLADELFRGYFAEGLDLNDPGALAERAAVAGLDPDEARQFLASGRFQADVSGSQQEAARLGVTGVPFYVLAGRYALSGAQPPAALAQALDQVEAQQTSP
jgi:predicted DsbA family dithiol-disulfide isomerase